jgi:SAM-dependent methyltransferase
VRNRDADVRELLDAHNLDEGDLRRNLADIRLINSLLGWTSYTSRQVCRVARDGGLQKFSLLDIAAGSADISIAVVRVARRAGLDAQVVATDINPKIVAIARDHAAPYPSVHVEQSDALALPYPSGSFDIVLCTLALHHFDPAFAVQVLRNMARVGRHVLVFDVMRSRAAYAGALLLTRATRMTTMTRHDAPVSVRRAYSRPELAALAQAAGIRNARIWVSMPFRLALSAPGEAESS